jgi:protein-glutamine gamma-glutamyltransferase
VNTPPLLLGLTLLFWGWQTGYAVIGAVLGALVELPRVINARWHFSQADLDRLWNLCALLFIGTMIYVFFNEGSISFNDFFVDAGKRPEAIREKGRAALLWFQWLPMIFFPFTIAIAFAEEQSVDVSTFSMFYRRRRTEREFPSVTIAFPYLAMTLFAAASSNNNRDRWFYIGFCALLAWAFWSQRAHRLNAVAWAALFAIVAVGGQFGHAGLTALQQKLEQMNFSWFTRYNALGLDAGKVRTKMGSLGKLKLSDRIIIRLRTDGKQPPPSLIREASYNIYVGASWGNTNREYKTIFEETNGSSWIVATNPAARHTVSIAQFLEGGRGYLAPPAGVTRLDHLPVTTLQRNPLGAMRVEGGPGLVMYETTYSDYAVADAPPFYDDLHKFDDSEPVLREIAQQIGLASGMETREAMRRVAGFFAEKFSYSSYVTAEHAAIKKQTELARFFQLRAGHCEYFASAAALLLRQANIPTRYAVGYSVQEGSGKKYIVRERHGHAWTLVWNGASWEDFDTTPGSWSAIEAKNSSWLRPFKDFFSNLWFQFSKWRWSNTDIRKYLIWVPAPLVVAALVTFFWKKQWRGGRKRPELSRASREWPGLDSEFYAVERALARRGVERQPNESWSAWLNRVERHTANDAALHRVVALHRKYRFDPHGLTPSERRALRDEARDCVQKLKR